MAVVCSVNDYRRISSKARKKAANLENFNFEDNYHHFMNDFVELADLLSQFPQGSVFTLGPGQGSMWWPEETEAIQNLFDHLGKELFKPLRGCGHPVFEGASLNIYRQMDRFKGVNGTNEHFDLTTTNHKQMISLVLMAENCSKFFGCLAEIASFYLQGSGRALPEITPTRKWSSGKGGTWRIGPSSLAWDANLGSSLPIVFFGKGAGCSEIPEAKPKSSTAVSSAVGDDQDDDKWGSWGASGNQADSLIPTSAKLCLEAGFVRPLESGDSFKTKPKPHRSGGSLESREYRRDSEDGPWEVLHVHKHSEALRFVDGVFVAKFPGTERCEVACGFSPLLSEIESTTPAFSQLSRASSFLLC